MNQLHHKSRLLVLGLFLILLPCAAAWLHEFYVSLTEIRHNPQNQHFEVSMRLFPDDLDRALLHRFDVTTHLATELEQPGEDTLLRIYLESHFHIKVDGAPVALTYLGKQPEGDAVWCFFESEAVKDPHSIKVRNSTLVDAFSDQINIVQVYAGNWNKGLMLSRTNPVDSLLVGD